MMSDKFDEATAPGLSSRPIPEPAVAALPKAALPSNRPAGSVPVGHPAVKGAEALSNASYGKFLRDQRLKRNLSLQELDERTRVASRYLEALEAEDLKKLPPLVYVIGYIRTLCRLYGISQPQTEMLLAELKGRMEYAVNEEIMNTVEVDRSASVAEVQLLKRRFFIGLAGLAVMAALVMLTVWAFRAGASKASAPGGATVTAERFDPNVLYGFVEPATVEIAELPVGR